MSGAGARRRTPGRSLALIVALTTPLAARSAVADDSSAALAQQLFDDAKAAMERKDYATACQKFAESHRVDPATGGTLLNLAVCHEKAGKIATAWAEFEEAGQLARHFARPDRESIARQHAASLRPRVSVATLRVPGEVAGLAGLRIALDGVELHRAAWDSVPLDPGEHEVRVEAPGKAPWSRVLVAGASGERPAIDVPPLRDEPLSAAPAPTSEPPRGPEPAPPAASRPGGAFPTGWVIAGIGAAGVAVGTVFGLSALQLDAASKRDCLPPTGSAAACGGDVPGQHAVLDANISNVAFGVGVVGLAVGTYLLLTGKAESPPPPRPEPRSAWRSVQVTSSPGGPLAGLGLRGAW